MTSNENIGPAILIVAAVYFFYILHIPDWAAGLMVILAMITWVWVFTDKEAKNLQLELIRAKISYYRSKTK